VHLLLLDAGAGAQAALAAARGLQQAAGGGDAAAVASGAAEPVGLVVACCVLGQPGGSVGATCAGANAAGVAWWAEACVLLRQELQHAGTAQVVEEPLVLLAPSDGNGVEVEEVTGVEEKVSSALERDAGADCAAAFSRKQRGAAWRGQVGGWTVGLAALVGALRAAVEEHNERRAKRAALAAT
jgi:hypothetical protein